MRKIIALFFVLFCLAAPLYAGQTAPDSVQSIYLQAGKEERSGSMAKARELYESIVDRFPESDFAVKANDRLLALPTARQKAESGKAASPFTLFAPAPAKPLPTDPVLRRGVEAARLKANAEVTSREEFEWLKRADNVRNGRKISKSRLAEKELSWKQAAAAKVVEEYGMTLEEITARAETACKEAGVKGDCNEEALTRRAPAAKPE